jgi:hypothetical protein
LEKVWSWKEFVTAGGTTTVTVPAVAVPRAGPVAVQVEFVHIPNALPTMLEVAGRAGVKMITSV